MTSGVPELARPLVAVTEPVWEGWRRIARNIDRAIGALSEGAGAALVLAEICILFAGVVSRYVFDSPLMWTDELANFLFLWLAMLGMVVALRRGEHMRLTTFVNALSPQWSRYLGRVGALVLIVFVIEILVPAAQYLEVQRSTELITLPLSDGYRVVAILVGAVLSALIALLRLLETTSWRCFLGALALVGAVALVLWLAQPLLIAMGHGSLVLFFVVLVAACVLIGVPIAFTFGIATFSYLALTTDLPLSIVVNRIDDGISNLLLLAVPMFVVLGLLMEMTGIARVMVNFLAALIGHVKGGLSYVLLGAMYLVSGISGSKAADMAAVAPILFPEMRRRGAHPGELASLLATSSAMSETIPPSLVLITIGSVTNISIVALFTGGLLPAFVAALGLVVVAWFRARRADTGAGTRAPVMLMARTFVIAVPGLTLPFVIRAAVIGGVVMLIIGTATAMAWALTQSGFSQWLVSVMAGVPGGTAGFLAITIIAFIILGSVLEGLPAIVLFGPLLFPVAKAMGVHEVHYAMIVILAMGIGLFAPPFGVGYYGACAIGRVSPDDALWRIWPYLGALVVALAIVAAIPWISIGFL